MVADVSQFDVDRLDFNNTKSIKNLVKLLFNITESLYQTNKRLRRENRRLRDRLAPSSSVL